jgi:uncharacterized phage-like protein YoqJ
MLTGHRLQDLPCKFEFKHPWKLNKLKQFEKYLLDTQPKTLISGMALGFDMWGAWCAIKVGIPLVAYVPFEGQESRWSEDHKRQFHALLKRAQHVDYVCEPGYAGWKMHKRNESMVRDSDLVLALWNPDKKHGGTWSTVAHASTVGKPILNFWHEPERLVELITNGE